MAFGMRRLAGASARRQAAAIAAAVQPTGGTPAAAAGATVSRLGGGSYEQRDAVPHQQAAPPGVAPGYGRLGAAGWGAASRPSQPALGAPRLSRACHAAIPGGAALLPSTAWHGSGHAHSRGFASGWWPLGKGSKEDSPAGEELEGGNALAASDPTSSPGADSLLGALPAEAAQSSAAIADALSQAEASAQAVAMSQGWWSSSLLIESMCQMTAALDVPWWVAITGVTLGVRTLLFPLMVYMEDSQIKLKKVQPELDRIKEKYPGVYSGDKAAQEGLKAESYALFKKHNMNPWSGLVMIPLGLTQVFVFGTFFFSLRYLSEAKIPSMMAGGTLWFPDLTVPDPTFGLPIMAAATMLAAVEVGAMDAPSGGQGSTMKNIMRAMSVSFLMMGPYFPSSLFVYFTTSNIFTMAQSSVMGSRAFRGMVGLPPRLPPAPGSDSSDFGAIWQRLKDADKAAREPGGAAGQSQAVKVFTRRPGKSRKGR